MKRIKMATVILMIDAVVSRSSTICGMDGRKDDDEKAARSRMDREDAQRGAVTFERTPPRDY